MKPSRTVRSYLELHDDDRGGGPERRKLSYAELVNQYYDLATTFYELGWGQSFHFAPMERGRSLRRAILEHERFIARSLDVGPGSTVVDLGCGVAGPMREIARVTGATIVGINNNQHQIDRGRSHLTKARLDHRCSLIKADFMDMPLDSESVDAVYAIESTCHAADRAALYREILRVLKPGGRFASFEWCLTDRYDPGDARHRHLKKDIEIGNGLPDLCVQSELSRALSTSGFRVLDERDLAGDPDGIPWYAPLQAHGLSLRGLLRGPFGRAVTRSVTRLLEVAHFVPEGTTKVSEFLNAGADGLVAAGELGIFTPMYFVLAQRPQRAR